MSMNAVGFVPPDAKYDKMKGVYDACMKANMDMPEEVSEFFNWEEPSSHGTQVDIGDAEAEYKADMNEGIEVDLSKLPESVTVVRFYCSW